MVEVIGGGWPAVIDIDWVGEMGPSTPIFSRKRVVIPTTIFGRARKSSRKIGLF